MDEHIKNSRVLLLQSGGRDSAIAAATLLDHGNEVLAVTFAANARQCIEVPKRRAHELARKYKKYSWQMVEFGEWEKPFKQSIFDEFGELPKSCLACALSKITAALSIAANADIDSIAMGYAAYQKDWAEQTDIAISVQRAQLEARGFNFLLPARLVDSKVSAVEILASSGLTSHSLENPCCISRHGTRPIDDALVVNIIDYSFNYFDQAQAVPLEIVDSLEGEGLCL